MTSQVSCDFLGLHVTSLVSMYVVFKFSIAMVEYLVYFNRLFPFIFCICVCLCVSVVTMST